MYSDCLQKSNTIHHIVVYFNKQKHWVTKKHKKLALRSPKERGFKMFNLQHTEAMTMEVSTEMDHLTNVHELISMMEPQKVLTVLPKRKRESLEKHGNLL